MRQFLSNYELVKKKMVEVEENDRIRNWQPPISGEEIMTTFGISPSRVVGDIKTAIREAILDGELANDPTEAKKYMIELGRKMGLATS